MSYNTHNTKRKENSDGTQKESNEICSSDEVIHRSKSKAEKTSPNSNSNSARKPLKTWIKVLIIITVIVIAGVIAAIIIIKLGGNDPGDPTKTTPEVPETETGVLETNHGQKAK